MRRPTLSFLAAALVMGGLVAACSDSGGTSNDPTCIHSGAVADTPWPSYGNDLGGTRFSALDEVTTENVHCLQKAWTFNTGDLPTSRGEHKSDLASEVTPVLAAGRLFLCTPYNRVIALDPVSGEQLWSYDPNIDLSGEYANQLVCRGVTPWFDPTKMQGEACALTVFTATNDARLIALDGASGKPCTAFGDTGSLDLNPGVGRQQWKGEYQITSPPAVGRDVVVVGSSISDNQRSDAPSGVIRAFDARTGDLRWAWDLRPPGFIPTEQNATSAGYALGTPNVWAPMSVDLERDLLFVPTGNPSPDYFRGDSNLDDYGSSLVALRLSTGEVTWHFQTVHHDLWDFDVPAQPTLFDLKRDGRSIPAVVQATKMGFLFILNRETGEPLFQVEERPVPQSPVPFEKLSPTQPFPLSPPALVRQRLHPDEAWGLTPFDRGSCRRKLAALRFDGAYTPPSLEGSLMLPGNAGGSNWGGVAVDEERQKIIANTQDFPWAVALVRRADADDVDEREHGEDVEDAPMRGAPYALRRWMVTSPLGVPCSPPPWGQLASVDLETGGIEWQVPLGTIRDLAPIPIPLKLGIPNLGGPLATGGGLIFIGAAMENTFRAFDAESGEEIWSARLPYGPQATPMTYGAGGRQFIVIAATGYAKAGQPAGDAIVAFALPAP